ncbi:MAG: hypothetical protein IKN12_00840 [Selenomonadaceae bacterium]|nr:hypothetical protein [Selenomonadaceae bacterium]
MRLLLVILKIAIRVQHTKGENIVISYRYVSESHEIYAAAAGWAKAA